MIAKLKATVGRQYIMHIVRTFKFMVLGLLLCL